MAITTRHGKIRLTKNTILMGILNITPDSFSDGGKFFNNPEKAISYTRRMLKEGADIIDIGGESTRPGAEKISLKEELNRVIPIIKAIRENIGDKVIISVDTYKSEVAKQAVINGADIINEVSGLQFDEKMPGIIAELNIPIIINHVRGEPKTMQKGRIVYEDIINDISLFFNAQIEKIAKRGFITKNIILDPGFGFGKTSQQNIEIIKRLNEFKRFNLPIMIGVSRKSTIGKILFDNLGKEFSPEERMEGSLAIEAIAVLKGVNILRVHDVYETKKFLAVLDNFKR